MNKADLIEENKELKKCNEKFKLKFAQIECQSKHTECLGNPKCRLCMIRFFLELDCP